MSHLCQSPIMTSLGKPKALPILLCTIQMYIRLISPTIRHFTVASPGMPAARPCPNARAEFTAAAATRGCLLSLLVLIWG